MMKFDHVCEEARKKSNSVTSNVKTLFTAMNENDVEQMDASATMPLCRKFPTRVSSRITSA
ncbi:hypothetical protein LJR143_000247 [Pseudoxanthomonas sp. LjRoot143]